MKEPSSGGGGGGGGGQFSNLATFFGSAELLLIFFYTGPVYNYCIYHKCNSVCFMTVCLHVAAEH